MKIKLLINLLFSFSFLFLSIFSFLMLMQERNVLKISASWQATDFSVDDDISALLAFSTASDTQLTDTCLRVVTSALGRVLPTASRQKMTENCTLLITYILASSKNNSYAWFLRAYLKNGANNQTDFNAALIKSYQTGPNEQWIAELRVLLAENAFGQLSEKAKAGHFLDLALLVQSRRGIRSIARRYVKDPDFRDRITDVVETLTDAAQRRFVSNLQREVRRVQNDI